jgi:hypothetical protein
MTLISFEKQLIFVKTTKTAGTSIEVDLSQCLEPGAVVTPIFPEVAGHVARNHHVIGDERGFFNHMSAGRIRNLLGEQNFSCFTKFCVEREPVSKCISHFHMLHNSPDHRQAWAADWDTYCEAARFPIDTAKYSENLGGKQHLIVDHVLRYDRLDQELPMLLADHGIEGFRLRSRAKTEYSQSVVVTRNMVTPAQQRKIYDAFAESIHVTGLTWSSADI